MSTTFREIETLEGVVPSENQEHSPLVEWYARIRDIPLSSFRAEDLCKSIRQCLFPEYVVPAAIEVLEKEPLAGEMYDGELASAFSAISETFWCEHKQIAARTLRVLKRVLPQFESDDAKGNVLAALACIEAAMSQS